MLLSSLLTDYYAPLKGISERTVRIYEFTLSAFSLFLGHEATTDDLEELAVARFLSDRLKRRSVGTAAKDRCQLRALWEFGARRGCTGGRWPQIRPIRVPERVPQAWLTDEMRRLLEACDGEEGEIVGVPARLWWRAALMTCYLCGERIGGVLSLEWCDVSPESVVFRAEGRKGRSRDIFCRITPECYEAIQAIKTDRKLVFDWDRSYTLIWRRLGKICERAGLPNDRVSKFHRIRKTTASYSAALGLDPQQVMGHKSAATTRRYLDPRIVRRTEPADVLPKVS